MMMVEEPVPLALPAAVIFDMDGVIVDSRQFHLAAWQQLGKQIGREMPGERFQELFGLENSQFIPTWFGRPVDPAEVARLADRKERFYRSLIARSIRLLPGVRELLERLSGAGVPLAVASSAPRANVAQILRSTAIDSRFRVVLSSDDVSRHKPDPEVFLTTARRLGVEPAGCLVVEDARYGIEAAHRAGMRCLAVATTHPSEALTAADAVLPDLRSWLAHWPDWRAGGGVPVS